MFNQTNYRSVGVGVAVRGLTLLLKPPSRESPIPRLCIRAKLQIIQDPWQLPITFYWILSSRILLLSTRPQFPTKSIHLIG